MALDREVAGLTRLIERKFGKQVSIRTTIVPDELRLILPDGEASGAVDELQPIVAEADDAGELSKLCARAGLLV